MKRITLLVLLTALLPSAGWADSSKCYSIKDSDMKNDCLASTKNDKSKCYSIRDADTKNSCLARVGKEKSKCYSIKDKDDKQSCLADF